MIFQSPEDTIRAHLQHNEKLLWSGRPACGIRLKSQDAILVPFSIFWTGFAVFWEIIVYHGSLNGHNAESNGFFSWILPLWGIPFILIGLYLLFGRFWVDAKRRENTVYGITNVRIIIISGLMSLNIKSVNLSSISDFALTEKSDRSGTIHIGMADPLVQVLTGIQGVGTGHNAKLSIEMIPDVNHTFMLLQDAYSQVQRKPDDLYKSLNPT